MRLKRESVNEHEAKTVGNETIIVQNETTTKIKIEQNWQRMKISLPNLGGIFQQDETKKGKC